MPDTRRPTLRRLEKQRNEMQEILSSLTVDTLVDVLRIAGMPDRPLEDGPGNEVVDGYPLHSSGAGEGGRGTSESTSTERAALYDNRAGVDEEEPDRWVESFDPVRELVGRFLGLMSEGFGVLRELDRARIHIDGHKLQLRGRLSTLRDCECCGHPTTGGTTDRIKAGLCSGKDTRWCYDKWVRAGRPERPSWIASQRKEIAVEVAKAAGRADAVAKKG